jgi:hypothetical protein
MIWNPWKRIKELELDVKFEKSAYAGIEQAFRLSMQKKDERITQLENDLALLLDGQIEVLNKKVKARLQVNSPMTASLNSHLAAAHNLRNHYMPPVGGIGNLMGGFF